EAYQRTDQCDPAHHLGLLLLAKGQQDRTKDDGRPNCKTQQSHFSSSLLVEQHEVRHGQEDTQNHDQCVVVHITRLQPAHQGGDAAHQLPGTVDDQAVDQALVAHLPKHTAQHARAAGEDVFVDPVHTVLAFQCLVQTDLLAHALDGSRNLGLDHVEHIGG